jgi:Pirin C-terminal cupin domain
MSTPEGLGSAKRIASPSRRRPSVPKGNGFGQSSDTGTAVLFGFVYVVEGSAGVGGGSLLETGQVGWLDRPTGISASTLKFAGGERGARIVLYAGEPQREPLVHHGPFAASSVAEIEEMFHRYRAGRFESMSAIARRARRENEART